MAVPDDGLESPLSALEVGASDSAVGVDVAGASRQRIMSDVCHATLMVGAKRFMTELEKVIVIF
jgi:hypothetical protein